MRSLAALSLCSLALSAGCIIHEQTPPPPFGDIAFDWSFAGETDCARAGVDFVDVNLFRGGEVYLVVEGEPCSGGGLVLTDIDAQASYEVQVQAFDRNGDFAYEGSFTVFVNGGELNDAGLVVLDDVRGPPPAETGTIAMFWSFPYPTDGNVITDCALAGADFILVTADPLGTDGTPYEETFNCDQADGVEIVDMVEGRYLVRVSVFGSYDNNDLLLYDTGDMTVDVFADQVADLGDIAVPRVEENFSDFDVAWTFAQNTCAGAGIAQVTLSFQRFGFDEPEDAFAVDCVATNVVRRTFVPASYTVSVFGDGPTDFLGSTTVDLSPGIIAEVTLQLAPL